MTFLNSNIFSDYISKRMYAYIYNIHVNCNVRVWHLISSKIIISIQDQVSSYHCDAFCVTFNPKTAGWRECGEGWGGGSIWPPYVLFEKSSKERVKSFFLWLLILSYGTSFLKISLKILESFRCYEELLCLY